MIEHALNHLTLREGWDTAVCGCGWESPPCPDPTTAANFWGQHLLAVAESKRERIPVPHNEGDDR